MEVETLIHSQMNVEKKYHSKGEVWDEKKNIRKPRRAYTAME